MAAHSIPTKSFDHLPFQGGQARSSNSWLRTLLLRFERWWLTHLNYRTTLKELSSLNDRELDDIGVVRADIRSIARQSANIEAARRF